MAITSTTGIVQGNEVLFEITTLGQARGIGVISYVNYTKGTSDSLEIYMKFKESKINDIFYYNIIVENDAISNSKLIITTSGQYRIPIPISFNEDLVSLEINGLVDGDINIEFSIDGNYM